MKRYKLSNGRTYLFADGKAPKGAICLDEPKKKARRTSNKARKATNKAKETEIKEG